MTKDNHSKIICNFCHAEEQNSKLLIEGDDCYICSLCISKSYNLLLSENEDNKNQIKIKKPHHIKAELDKTIIGQDNAKKTVSVASDS